LKLPPEKINGHGETQMKKKKNSVHAAKKITEKIVLNNEKHRTKKIYIVRSSIFIHWAMNLPIRRYSKKSVFPQLY
jgi:hypothetical protein